MLGDKTGEDMAIFSGNANPDLAREIAAYLGTTVGDAVINRFNNGEVQVMINESVRGKDVFVIQPTCGPAVNDNVMADLMTVSGITRLVTVDLHAAQIQGFFDIPVDHMPGGPILADYVKEKGFAPEDMVVISPDLGGVSRARNIANRLECGLAIIDKRRPEPGVAEVMNLIGNVEGKICIMVDDIVDTAGSLCEGAKALKKFGAKDIYACVTHPILTDPALSRIAQSEIKELIVTNTIPLPPNKKHPKITQLSVAPILAETILRIYNQLSISQLFEI